MTQWVKKLAERAAYMSHHASNGGGPPIASELSQLLTIEAKKHKMDKGKLMHLIVAEWRRLGVIK